jgi:peptide/nickel transport system permease protein
MTGLEEGLALRSTQALTVGVALIVMIALFWFLNRTKSGKAMRACAINREAAALQGIPVSRMLAAAFAISAGLGAMAGILITPTQYTAFNVGVPFAISGFIAAIVGGFGRPFGAFLGGLMLVLVFSIWLDWLPTSGMENVVAFHEGWDRVVDIARHLVLPTVTLSLFYLALYARLMRASMLEQRGLDYVTTARAKGQSDRKITTRHVFRNALLPVVTMAGVQTGGLLGGSVVVEAIFAWPGLGQLAFQSLFARDYNLLLGIFFMSAVLVVIVNLIVDVIYVFLDPRIRIG